MFWLWILAVIAIVIGASVFIGLRLKDSRKHKVRREEMLALKASGAFSHRKSNMP